MVTAHHVQHRKVCDLVMKGGITSGIVYPKAVAELAKTYEFASIGGTSAGGDRCRSDGRSRTRPPKSQTQERTSSSTFASL
jgi:hypothetical protein